MRIQNYTKYYKERLRDSLTEATSLQQLDSDYTKRVRVARDMN